jgi:mycothiol maleylpyruvate isomerase-like protein
VNAADVDRVVRLALDLLSTAVDRDWSVPARGLDWSCAETVEHVAHDLFTYAMQLAPARPALTGYVPVARQFRREGGPGLRISADPAAGVAGLLQVLEASGALLTAMLTVVPDDRRSYHLYGPSDPSGFAAMAVVEVVVHLHDVAGGLGLDWLPPADLCAAALRRLFPAAPPGEAWAVLLECTGRGAVARPGWTWDASPRLV